MHDPAATIRHDELINVIGFLFIPANLLWQTIFHLPRKLRLESPKSNVILLHIQLCVHPPRERVAFAKTRKLIYDSWRGLA